MKDNLKVYLNKKKVLIFAPLALSLLIIVILLELLVMYFITNRYYIPAIQQNKSDSWAILTFLIMLFLLAIPFFIGIILAISLAIRAIRKKEVLVINHRGILYNQHYTFSKPIFIHWNYIEDVRIIEGVRQGLAQQKLASALSNNNKITLKLKKEFYTDFSPIKKIMYKLNSKILKGFAFAISLSFTDGDVDEIFNIILNKYSSRMQKNNKQKIKFNRTKDKFVGYFNTKKIILYSLGLLITNLIFISGCIYVFTLPASTIITAKLPIIGKTKNQFLIKGLVLTFSICNASYSMYLWSLLIKLIKDKKFFVISPEGILWYNYNIFSKPILIEWQHIEELYVLNPKRYLFSSNYKHAIVLKITKEFYNSSSFFTKIIYMLNRKFSEGYEISINLNFAKCNAVEVFNEMQKYWSN